MPSALPPPAQVRFACLYQPDISALAESLIPFGRWSEEHIATQLPVVVSYPAEISQRVNIMRGYLAASGWPSQVPSDAIESIRALVEQTMPGIEAEIAQAVRLIAAAAIRDDGSRAITIRDQALSSFLASKMFATARALRYFTLVGEPILAWGAEFYETASVSSHRLIHGLSFLAREPYGWAGWTDADLWVDERGYRLYAPICPRPEETINIDALPPEEVRRLIIPQLLRSDVSFLTLRRLAFEPWATFAPNLILRAKVFVDAETCRAHRQARSYITRIAADRIVSRLQRIPLKARWRQLIEMSRSLDPVSFDVEARVKDEIQLN